MATKYYTHFVTGTDRAQSAPGNEWSGVVELREPLTQGRANRELRSLLAQSFDLDTEEIRILHWARLHLIPWRTSFPSSKVRPSRPQA